MEESKLDEAEATYINAFNIFERYQHIGAFYPLELLHDIYDIREKSTQQKELKEKYINVKKQYVEKSFKLIKDVFPADSEHLKRIRKKYSCIK